ncbi:MAG TPA: hypothetical protein EYP78_04465 [Candidatus Omnitrophica bacterium]|nr:hypothetical protein [Candidatus Omnitrophota bacterium]
MSDILCVWSWAVIIIPDEFAPLKEVLFQCGLLALDKLQMKALFVLLDHLHFGGRCGKIPLSKTSGSSVCVWSWAN